MTRISEITEHWFGLCRKPPAVHALQTYTGIPPESAYERTARMAGAADRERSVGGSGQPFLV